MKLPQIFSKFSKSPRFSSRRLTYVWYRHYKSGFALLFFLTLAWGGYIWYINIYQYQWNEAQKKQYLASYFQETALKEKEFQTLVAHLKDRAERHKTPLHITRDIFEGARP